MKDSEKENLFATFKGVILSIIEDKRKNPKNLKTLNNFKGRINLGLQIEEDFYFWMNLVGENGNFEIGLGKLEDNYDLDIMAAPEDLMFFSNGENSIVHMVTKKNRFGLKKLRFKPGTTGRNLGLLLKLPKILVLDKIKQPK